MTALRKNLLLWTLLPLLALRGLVPAGYMVDTSGGRLSIVMCGGEGPLTVAALNERSGHQMHHGQDHHEQMGHAQHHHEQSADGGASHGGEHEKHKNSLCPFAIAASAATFAGIPMLPAAIEPLRVVVPTNVVALHGLVGPSRTQQSRAPPYSS